MAEETCPSCGARNPAGTEFCQALRHLPALGRDLDGPALRRASCTARQPCAAPGAERRTATDSARTASASRSTAGPRRPRSDPRAASARPLAAAPCTRPARATPRALGAARRTRPSCASAPSAACSCSRSTEPRLTGAGAAPATRTTWWQRLTGRGATDRAGRRCGSTAAACRCAHSRCASSSWSWWPWVSVALTRRPAPQPGDLARQLSGHLRNTRSRSPSTAESVTVSGGKAQPATERVVDGNSGDSLDDDLAAEVRRRRAPPAARSAGRPRPCWC